MICVCVRACWRAGVRVELIFFGGAVRCTDIQKIKEIGVPVKDFIRVGVDAQTRQLLEFGLFHGDPHPGNIFALRYSVYLFH